MNNGFWKKNQTSIDLTSLLDVIFIVLLVVMCAQRLNMQDIVESEKSAKEQVVEIQDELAATQEEVSVYKEQIDTLENEFENMGLVSVSVNYVPSDIKNRTITVLINDEEPITISLTPDNKTEALGELENKLNEFISAKADIPVIISVDTSDILYRDENAVNGILDALFEQHDNLYRKAGSDDAK